MRHNPCFCLTTHNNPLTIQFANQVRLIWPIILVNLNSEGLKEMASKIILCLYYKEVCSHIPGSVSFLCLQMKDVKMWVSFVICERRALERGMERSRVPNQTLVSVATLWPVWPLCDNQCPVTPTCCLLLSPVSLTTNIVIDISCPVLHE